MLTMLSAIIGEQVLVSPSRVFNSPIGCKIGKKPEYQHVVSIKGGFHYATGNEPLI